MLNPTHPSGRSVSLRKATQTVIRILRCNLRPLISRAVS